ncbi:MAG: PhaM family polyhydroxyalkanoate granule multifunctional regulatory protein [Burkholderia sp.]|nr:MAG: hypothetical protein E5299_01713 [Burkholderia gladioli]
MTDTPGSNPFTGFTSFTPSDMFDRMWEMMQLLPFGIGIGAVGSSDLPPALSTMPGVMSLLLSVEELDKRTTDLRAVEQWLKLNLGMLQSALQALEAQRAALATLRAFGALAQELMLASEAAMASGAKDKATEPACAVAFRAALEPQSQAFGELGPVGSGKADAETPLPGREAFDAVVWWNLLQSQFNQLASFAMTQPGPASSAPAATEKSSRKRRSPLRPVLTD